VPGSGVLCGDPGSPVFGVQGQRGLGRTIFRRDRLLISAPTRRPEGRRQGAALTPRWIPKNYVALDKRKADPKARLSHLNFNLNQLSVDLD